MKLRYFIRLIHRDVITVNGGFRKHELRCRSYVFQFDFFVLPDIYFFIIHKDL